MLVEIIKTFLFFFQQFNPLYTNGFFLLVLCNKIGMVHCTYIGVSRYNFKIKYCILLSEDLFTFTNSVDPDEMQHNAAFHLGLHCLQMYLFKGFPITKG